jgi:hypothetical protein
MQSLISYVSSNNVLHRDRKPEVQYRHPVYQRKVQRPKGLSNDCA